MNTRLSEVDRLKVKVAQLTLDRTVAVEYAKDLKAEVERLRQEKIKWWAEAMHLRERLAHHGGEVERLRVGAEPPMSDEVFERAVKSESERKSPGRRLT